MERTAENEVSLEQEFNFLRGLRAKNIFLKTKYAAKNLFSLSPLWDEKCFNLSIC